MYCWEPQNERLSINSALNALTMHCPLSGVFWVKKQCIVCLLMKYKCTNTCQQCTDAWGHILHVVKPKRMHCLSQWRQQCIEMQ